MKLINIEEHRKKTLKDFLKAYRKAEGSILKSGHYQFGVGSEFFAVDVCLEGEKTMIIHLPDGYPENTYKYNRIYKRTNARWV